MKAYKWILCVVLVLAIGFCFIRFGNFQTNETTTQDTAETAAYEEPVVTEFNFSSEDFNNRLLTVLNAYRERFGLAAWAKDDLLTAAAKTRATECASQGSKSHTRPDGSEWFTVLNITENYNYSEITGVSGQSPDDLLRSWTSSATINNGLLSPDYTTCGIECEAIGSDVYCVLLLYKP